MHTYDIYPYAYICVYIYINICVDICVYKHMYVCINIYVYKQEVHLMFYTLA